MKYELDMASLDGAPYRWEELTLAIKQRDSIIAEYDGVL